MVFGTCCFADNNNQIKAKSIDIEAEQFGLITCLKLTQTFKNSQEVAKEIKYVFPNDIKICIFDITFYIGDQVIKPKLQKKEDAEKAYKEAVDKGHSAILGMRLGDGLNQINIGNIPSKTKFKVALKCAFTSQLSTPKDLTIRIPMDVYTPSGSKECLQGKKTNFEIHFQELEIEDIISNCGGEYEENTKKYVISHNNISNITKTHQEQPQPRPQPRNEVPAAQRQYNLIPTPMRRKVNHLK